MYDELVRALRRLSDWSIMDFEDNLSYANQIADEAADAIENMSEAYDKLSRHMDDLAALMPRWIPVKERLPEAWWPVLGLIKFLDKDEPPAQQVLWYLGNGHWREVWRGDMIESDVTHWMPLPKGPEEE